MYPCVVTEPTKMALLKTGVSLTSRSFLCQGTSSPKRRSDIRNLPKALPFVVAEEVIVRCCTRIKNSSLLLLIMREEIESKCTGSTPRTLRVFCLAVKIMKFVQMLWVRLIRASFRKKNEILT